MEECICHRQGQMECKPLPCAAGETCLLSDAKWSCVRQEGHCTIAHRHTFTTYDGVSGNLPSDGSYEISSLIDTKAEYWFRVVVKVHKCPTCPTPAVDAVTVYFRNLIVLVNQNAVVSVRNRKCSLSRPEFDPLFLPLSLSLATLFYSLAVAKLWIMTRHE